MHPAIKNHIRAHFIELEGYTSAGMEMKKSAEKVFLNANENPYPLPGLEHYNRYPEPQPADLLALYAQNYGVKEEQIVMTRGADEAIAILGKVFCEPDQDNILTCPPTFGVYKVYAGSLPAGAVEVPLIEKNGTFELDSDNIIRATKDPANHVKMVYLCSPNNPTANSFDHSVIRHIIKELEGHAIVILDETYAEFAKQGSLCREIGTMPNLIILRTLSKSYALAGMRMGCMICNDANFITLVKTKAMEAYPLPVGSIEAARHVFKPEIKKLADENIQKLLAERDRIIPLLEKCASVEHIYPSDANFLLIKMKNAQEFCAYAAQHNVVLRDFSKKKGTQGCLRISVGTREQNDLLLTLMNDFAG